MKNTKNIVDTLSILLFHGFGLKAGILYIADATPNQNYPICQPNLEDFPVSGKR
jgi:hypothetical protein